MKYLIIGLMIIAACMLLAYFVAVITKKRKTYALFRLLLLILEIMLIVTGIVSFVLGMQFYILIPLIFIFAILLYDS
ncbi:MAG: hypothetical protein Q4D51_09650 [Eubacteriales bacterium]|nr:hypothetical protein [Eubacteriales bacterium]